MPKIWSWKILKFQNTIFWIPWANGKWILGHKIRKYWLPDPIVISTWSKIMDSMNFDGKILQPMIQSPSRTNKMSEWGSKESAEDAHRPEMMHVKARKLKSEMFARLHDSEKGIKIWGLSFRMCPWPLDNTQIKFHGHNVRWA